MTNTLAWNKGISTKALGKSRPVIKKTDFVCRQCSKTFTDWSIYKRTFCNRSCAARYHSLTNNNSKLVGVSEKISKAKKGLPSLNQRADKHWNWAGGISKINRIVRNCVEYKNWRSSVFKRDVYTCQLCSRSGCYIEADHFPVLFSVIIKTEKISSLLKASKSKKLWDISNGRTLCKECHYKITFKKC